jgi:8-oxo-dGTP diphosphatase
MKQLVVGFLFNEELTEAVLIRKHRPSWQVGLLNGMGGHVEPGEEFDQAMQREGCEESSIDLAWTRFAMVFIGQETLIAFYYATTPQWRDARTVTDEPIAFVGLDDPEYGELAKRTDLIPNLKWLIPMALNHARSGQEDYIQVKYATQLQSQEW